MGGKIIRELIGTRKDETGLDRCPWCNEDVPLAVSSYEGEWAAVAYCDNCDTSMVAEGESKEGAIENLKAKWKTRYERTCRMEDTRSGEYAEYDCQEHCYICSSCYSDFTLIYLGEDGGSSCEMPVYCPTCGAKVVDE